MKTALYLLLTPVLYKAALNFSRCRKVKIYEKCYSNYLSSESMQFLNCEPEILHLFKTAGLADVHFAVSESLDCDLVAAVTVSHFGNLSKRKPQTIRRTRECFSQAACIFRQRTVEAFSPLYWAEALLYLPRSVFSYLGLSTDTLTVKVLQLLYWLLTPLLLLFRDQLYQHILALLG